MKVQKFLVFALVACLGLAVFPAPSNAAFLVSIDDGVSGGLTIQDNMAGDANPVVGIITAAYLVGNFTGSVETALSKPAIGPHQMDLNFTAVSTGTGGTLTFMATDTDFSPFPMGSLVGEIGGTSQGTLTAWAYKNDSNREFDITSAETEIHLGPLGPGLFGATASDPHGPLPTHSFTLVTAVTHGAGMGVVTTGDFFAENAVPEPTAIAAWTLLGLFGLAAYRRRNRQ